MTSLRAPVTASSITITGTRSVDGSGELQLAATFERFLTPFAQKGTRFYVGGAVGIDTAALDWLADNTESALTVVVPCAVIDQPERAVTAIRRWEARQRSEVIELGAQHLGTSAYHARNRWMADRSEFVIGFPRGPESESGTWYTLRYAADQGKPRLIVPV